MSYPAKFGHSTSNYMEVGGGHKNLCTPGLGDMPSLKKHAPSPRVTMPILTTLVQIGMKSKNWECWDPSHWDREHGWALKNTALPRVTMPNLVHSGSNCMRVWMEICQKKMSPSVFPFKVNQCRQN